MSEAQKLTYYCLNIIIFAFLTLTLSSTPQSLSQYYHHLVAANFLTDLSSSLSC